MKEESKFAKNHPKLFKFLSEKAPHILGSVEHLPGPLGAVFGAIKNLLPSDPRVAEQDKVELMKLLTEAQIEREKLDLEFYKVEVDDRKDARSREVEITRTTGKRDWILGALSIFGVAAPFCLVIYLMKFGLREMPPEISMLVGGLIGIIVGEYKTVFNYFMGSSRGSRDKTGIMGDSMKK